MLARLVFRLLEGGDQKSGEDLAFQLARAGRQHQLAELGDLAAFERFGSLAEGFQLSVDVAWFTHGDRPDTRLFRAS